jgi:hypothetical protein
MLFVMVVIVMIPCCFLYVWIADAAIINSKDPEKTALFFGCSKEGAKEAAEYARAHAAYARAHADSVKKFDEMLARMKREQEEDKLKNDMY